ITQALPTITDSVHIEGNGMGATTVSANTTQPVNYRIFRIDDPAVSVTIEELRITGGKVASANGGGILDSGNLFLNNVEIDHCTAVNGGGLAVAGGGRVVVLDVSIHNNTAYGLGGGIYVSSTDGTG